VTATTLTVGAAIPTGTGSVANAFGIKGAGSVAEEDIWKAVVDDVNKSGGVLGRKVVLYNHSVDFASYVANPEKTYGEICADFKDDHKVYAAFIYIGDPSLRSCFAKMGTPMMLYGAFTTMPEAAFAANGGGYLYAPNSITHERLAQLFVQSLVANNFMAKWDTTNGGPGIEPVKLGIIHADSPDQNNLYAAYTRELAKNGWKVAETITYSGSASDALAATQGAVLKMKSDGITHVFGASAFFLRDAENQHYRPRYAYLPGLGALGTANSPAEQLKGALTVGWSPTQDVDAPQDPGPLPGAARCDAVMKRSGLASGNRQDIKLEYAVCDALYSFQAALTAGQEATVPGLRRGYEALGASFRAALTFTSVFGPGRHYGVSSVRDMAYDSECSCLKYTSRTNRS
jgi:ABC-type branched-subunit amino acid transport system substrate-binding protein